MVECKISKIIPLSDNKNNPIKFKFSAHFENGDFLPDGAKKLECFYAKSRADENSRHTIAVTDNNVYFGEIGHGFPTDLVRTVVAIRKKSTNKIRLVEVDNVNMLSHHLDDTWKVGLGQKERSMQDARRLLIKSFGSKQAIRGLDRYERNRFNVDLVANQLNKTIEEFSIKQEPDEEFIKEKILHDKYMESMLPKFNKNAQSLDEVYTLSDLIDEGLLHRMNEEAIALLKLEEVSEVFKMPFIVNIVKKIQKSKEPDSDENLRKVKVCIYIDALINLLSGLNVRRKNMEFAPFSEITKKVESDIRVKFAQPHDKKLIKSNYTIHKTTCFIIILSLLVSDYEVNMDDMVQALKTSKSNLLQKLASIPARYKDRSKMILLQLPSKLRTRKTSFRRRRTN